MAINSVPDMTYMDQFIADNEQSTIALKNFYDTILVKDINNPDHIYRVPFNDFFLEYQNELQDIIQAYSVPQSMYYKPKLLSLSLYGTTELWLSLLRVNGMRNITEFNRPVIYIYNSTRLKELINIFFKRRGIMM